MTSKERVSFKKQTEAAFAEAIKNCTTQEFELRLFRYDPDHPGALSTISYSIPLTAEQRITVPLGR